MSSTKASIYILVVVKVRTKCEISPLYNGCHIRDLLRDWSISGFSFIAFTMMNDRYSSDDEEGWEDLPDELIAEAENATTIASLPITIARTERVPSQTATPQPTRPTRSTDRTRLTTMVPYKPNKQKKTIISHPLEHIGLKCAMEFMYQLYCTDWTFRCSMLLLALSMIFRMILYSCYIYIYPRQVLYGGIWISVIGFPFIAWNQTNIRMALHKLCACDSRHAILELLEDSLSSQQVRGLILGVSYVLPTLFTIRTFQFLVELTSVSVVATTSFFSSIIFFMHHHYDLIRSTQLPLYILYGCALLSLYKQEWRHLPSIASHFLLATSMILYQKSDGNLSEILQRTLRCTIRTILVDAKTTVEQDELLKLTMLRWLAEYWASSHSNGTTSTPNVPPSNRNEPTPNPTTTTEESSHEVEWPELSTMLQQTTTQMTQEMIDLQSSNRPSQKETDESRPSVTTGNTVMQQQRAAAPNEFASSMESLQAMLTSMDLDSDAKPAVQSYKRMVCSIPPKQSTAVFLGLMHRLPATILVTLYCILSMFGRYHPPTITLYFLLLPFVAIELLYVQEWIEACRGATGAVAPDLPRDAMIFWLVDRSPDSSLLHVWRNVNASVSALETGLVAARCVQTTALAADFCANMLSLASLGLEVSQHGWLHGLQIVVRELIHLQQTATPVEQLTHGIATPAGASYTSAAVSAVRNSQRMGRNIQVLAQEHGTLQALAPIAGAVPVLVGQGWLWDSQRRTQGQLEESRVESMSSRIVEIVPETEAETNQVPITSDPGHMTNDSFRESNPTDGRETALPLNNPIKSVDPQDKAGHETQDARENNEPDAVVEKQDDPPKAKASIEDDNKSDDSFEPIACSETDSLHLGERAIVSVEEESTDDEKQQASGCAKGQEETADEDNLWIKVGAGGLAIVGAVAALAATHHRISEGKRQADRKEGRPS